MNLYWRIFIDEPLLIKLFCFQQAMRRARARPKPKVEKRKELARERPKPKVEKRKELERMTRMERARAKRRERKILAEALQRWRNLSNLILVQVRAAVRWSWREPLPGESCLGLEWIFRSQKTCSSPPNAYARKDLLLAPCVKQTFCDVRSIDNILRQFIR